MLPLALSAGGQQFQPKTIQFKGDPEYSIAELMEAAGLKQGAVLTSAEMNSYAKRLMDSGVFDDLAYKFDGADLVFTLTPAEQMFPIHIENLPLTPGPELDAELHHRMPLYHGKVPAKGALLDSVRDALTKMIAGGGIEASVSAAPYSDPKQRGKVTAMSFRIDEPPVYMGPVRLHGASAEMAPRLQFIAMNAGILPFDSENSPADLERRLISFYRGQGYAAIKLEVKRSGSALASADAIRIPYEVTIVEGKVYATRSFHMPAGALITQKEADQIAHSQGDSASGSALNRLLGLIETRYKSKGYLDLSVTPRPELNENDATADYAFDIEPGPVYHVSFVKFDNVSDSLRTQLMRKWQLLPGEPFDQSYVESFILKAQEHDPVLQSSLKSALLKSEITADPVTHDVSLVIRLEEQP